MRIPSTWSAMALLGALAACGDIPTRPATPAASVTASSALTITGLSCVDEGGGGTSYNNTSCWATATGGTGGYTWDWDVIVNYQSDSGSSSYIEGVCTNSYPVSVTVRDGSGATATASKTFRCYASTSGGGIEP